MLDTGEITIEMNNLITDRRFKEILDRAEQLIEEHPESYIGRWWKARAYTFLGDTVAALHWYMEAMKKAEDDLEESKISSSMANVYNINKDWKQALNYTEIALELNEANVVAIIARSIALVASGKKKEAYQLLDSNRKLFEDDYQKACVASIKRDKKKMLEHLKKAIIENPHTKVTILYDPDFAPYWSDSEFRSLLMV